MVRSYSHLQQLPVKVESTCILIKTSGFGKFLNNFQSQLKRFAHEHGIVNKKAF